MAREVVTRYTDDLDKRELSKDEHRVVTFSVNGKHYRLDLSPENETKFLETLEPYVRVATRETATRKSGGASSKVKSADVREWAQKSGYTVASRGKIPQEIIQAYLDAH